jgi:hypothetical protein
MTGAEHTRRLRREQSQENPRGVGALFGYLTADGAGRRIFPYRSSYARAHIALYIASAPWCAVCRERGVGTFGRT